MQLGHNPGTTALLHVFDKFAHRFLSHCASFATSKRGSGLIDGGEDLGVGASALFP